MKPRIYTAIDQADDDRYSTNHEIGDQEEEEKEEIYDDEDDNEDYDFDYDEHPVWTFRVIYLGSLSCLFLFVLNKFFLYQTAQCIMSMVTVVAILYPIGHIMAKLMPKRRIYWRTFGLEFSLNPGSFDTREYVLISIFANTGAAYGGITSHSVHSHGY